MFTEVVLTGDNEHACSLAGPIRRLVEQRQYDQTLEHSADATAKKPENFSDAILADPI